MALNPAALAPGEEQFEEFAPSSIRNGQTRIQYDYRSLTGKLFSCVKKTLEECRAARSVWLGKHYTPSA